MNTGLKTKSQGSKCMKSNVLRIFFTAVMLAVFFAALTGCGSDKPTETQKGQNTTQTSIQETTIITTTKTAPTAIQGKEEETLTGWSTAYKKVVVGALKNCQEKYLDESNYGGYGLYDFDSDNIPELFLEVNGSTSVDQCIRIYDFDGDEAVFIDSIESAHSWVYGTNRNDAFLTESCWTGVSVWNIYELKNGKFVSKELTSYYPDGFGASIQPQENPLPGMGYETKKIEYYFLDDLSGMSNVCLK